MDHRTGADPSLPVAPEGIDVPATPAYEAISPTPTKRGADGRGRTAAKLLGRTVVTLFAVTTLVLSGVGAYRATVTGAPLAARHVDPDKTSTDANRVLLQQYELLRAEMAAMVPRGSRMYLGDASCAMWGEQRLAEFAALNGIVLVEDVQHAEYIVELGNPQGNFFHLIVTKNG